MPTHLKVDYVKSGQETVRSLCGATGPLTELSTRVTCKRCLVKMQEGV